MIEGEMIRNLKGMLSEKRFCHTMGVVETAQQLADLWNEDPAKIRIAALLHDCSKYMSTKEMIVFLKVRSVRPDDLSVMSGASLLHSTVSMLLAKEEYGVEDLDILSAIECHTLGKTNMSVMDKIIFVSDYIEPGRNVKGVDDLRELAKFDLDQGVVECVNTTVRHLLTENKLLHPKLLDVRNDILSKRME